jgi:hypothetical protein
MVGETNGGNEETDSAEDHSAESVQDRERHSLLSMLEFLSEEIFADQTAMLFDVVREFAFAIPLAFSGLVQKN